MFVDKFSFLVLKLLYKADAVPLKGLPKQQMQSAKFLVEQGLAQWEYPSICDPESGATFKAVIADGVSISIRGRDFFEKRIIERWKYWSPIGVSALLSVAAIVISIISLMQG